MTTMLFQGHGSYRFTLDDDTVIYVDPYFGKEYELEADLVLVTHEHFDHDAVDKMPHAPGCEVIRAKDLHPTSDEYLSTESHGVKIQAVQAYNKNHPSDECVGYVLEFDGVSFYAAGDTSMTEDMKSGKLAAMKLDYAAFPCDGVYNMDVDEASECAKLVGAKHNIPIHEVPIDSDADSAVEFDADKVENFEAPGRIILVPGAELHL